MTGLIAAAVALVVIAAWATGAYNRLVGLRKQVAEAFALAAAQARRRHELAAPLAELANRYMRHERQAVQSLEVVADAAGSACAAALRNPAEAEALGAMARAEAALSEQLAHLRALADAYPDLKADADMVRLSEELASAESKLAFSRHAFDEAVGRYNTAIRQWPARPLAQLLRFQPAAQFDAA
jgi:LemA protein